MITLQGTKIMTFVKRFNKIYILDDMWTVTEYLISDLKELTEKSPIEIKVLRKLDFIPADKIFLEENWRKVFSSFVPAALTNKLGYKINERVFKLFDENLKLY